MSVIRRDFSKGQRLLGGACQATPVVCRGTHGEPGFGAMVGRSAAMRAIFSALRCAADTESPVLIYGETGTGKEIAVESIHAASARRDAPFVVVDCAAIASPLLESAFERAPGGSVFLDEIGDLGLDLQPKLLRAIERRQLEVRLMAATHHHLPTEVERGRFRADLYYRIAVIEVRMPPLRDRSDDIAALVECFLSAEGASERAEADLLRAALGDLERHAWPGNVRELKNYVERVLTLTRLEPLAGEEPAPRSAPTSSPIGLRAARQKWIHEFEERYLRQLLERHHDNVSAAARAAGVDRKYFHRLLVKHGMR